MTGRWISALPGLPGCKESLLGFRQCIKFFRFAQHSRSPRQHKYYIIYTIHAIKKAGGENTSVSRIIFFGTMNPNEGKNNT
jgi:hypothetical protein